MLCNKKITTRQCLTSRHEEKPKNQITFNLNLNKIKEDECKCDTQRVKKRIKFRKINVQKSPISSKENVQKNNYYSSRTKNNLKEDWSIFSPNFFKDNIDNTPGGKNSQINENNPPPPANYIFKIPKPSLDFSSSDTEYMNLKGRASTYRENSNNNNYKRDLLIKEVNELKENNKKIFNLMIEKEKENKELNIKIDNYKADSIEQFSTYLDLIEELGQKYKIFSDDFNNEINNINNNKFKTEEEFELNKKTQLTKILEEKNKEFDEINESIKKLIFRNDSIFNNSEKTGIEENNNNKINDNEESEINKIKEEYDKLKNEYIELENRFNKKKDNTGTKNRIKFVYKDISLGLKEKYEAKIKELIETNENNKNSYNKQLEEINMNFASMKVKYLNKQFENENKLMEMKAKIKNLITQCDNSGITINIDRDI